MYGVNVDSGNHKVKFWRWVNNHDIQLVDEKDVTPTADETYNLRVVAANQWLSYYVNDVLVASTGDAVLQKVTRANLKSFQKVTLDFLIGMPMSFSKTPAMLILMMPVFL